MIRRPLLPNLLALCLALVAPALATSVAAAQTIITPQAIEAGRVDVRDDGRFARIVFSFEQRPKHQMSAQNGVLVIRFERTIDISVDALTRELRNYVSSARRDPDGTAIRIALSRKVRINSAEAGNQLFVDLLPEPWVGGAPALPAEVVAELQRRAEEAERLRREEEARQRRRAIRSPIDLTIGEAPTFTRLEFRSSERVVATVSRGPREVRISFERVGVIELGPIRARLPRFLDGIRTEDGDDRLIIVLDVDAVRDVRSFEDANAFVVDIMGPERAATEFRSDGVIRRGDGPSPGQSTLMRGAPRPEAVAPTPTPAPPTPQQAAPQRRVERALPSPPDRPPDLAQSYAALLPPANLMPTQTSASASGVLDDDIITGTVGRSGDMNPAVLLVEAREDNGSIAISFGFQAETPAAVFQRGQSLWMIFSSQRRLDGSALQRSFPQRFRNVATTQRQGYSIVRAEIEGPFLTSAQVDGTGWIITIGDTIATPPRGLQVLPRSLADGRTSVTIDLTNVAELHRIPDPIVGDELIVATSLPPISAMLRQQTYVDFTILSSAQGLALRAFGDDLQASTSEQGVFIQRDAGLQLSFSGAQRAAALGPGHASVARMGFLDFEGWKFGAPDRFIQIRDALVSRASSSEGAERRAARLDLTRFYLAHGLGAEASIVLFVVRQEEPAFESDPIFRFLRGAASVLAGRYEVASRDLALPEFNDLPDIALWRGLIAERAGSFVQARRLLDRARDVLGSYPRHFQARVLNALAVSVLEANDIGTAQSLLEELRTLDTGPEHRARVAFLTARIAEVQGRGEEAISGFQSVEVDGGPEIRATARARRIYLQMALRRITPEVAAGLLESVTFDWRGDSLETEIYLRLATLYFRQNQDRAGFIVARRAMTASAESPTARQTQDLARDRFIELFAEGGADDLPAVQALALFYDFRELLPSGRRGDEMIRALSDRLLEVDLLEQAIELLAHQVDNRLEGAQRADVAAQLGFIHLLNRDPEKALAAIRRTQIARLPNEIERRRRLIEARSLAALGRPDIGIELLGDDDSEATRRLRADLLWEGRSWALAAAALETLSLRAGTSGALSTPARVDVLRAAVAFALANEQPGLDRLRASFASRMADTPESHAFNVLTSPTTGHGVEYRNLMREVSTVDTLQNFLRDYRERFGARRAQGNAQTGG
jgi:hypothetical protein